MSSVGLNIVKNATCTFCGCVCDDMELTVEGHKITKAKNACVLGKAWFLEHTVEDRPVALGPKETATVRHAAIAFTTATSGINVPGTVYRMDDVPIHRSEQGSECSQPPGGELR